MEARLPGVTVVVPVKNSQRTIHDCVESLLGQDYDGALEIILVGDIDDPTWGPIEHRIEHGDVTVIETQVESPARDANAKRNFGLWRADGEVLALTDSDMVMPADWITRGVKLIQSGWACVGGEMHSENPGLWNCYIDGNPVASKTPRMDPPYVLTAKNSGVGRCKLPITANVFFSREVFEVVGGFDADFVWSYEDYEFFERVVGAGFPILCTSELTGVHYHRQGLKRLLREYRGAGRGCAQFIAKHPRSRFSRKRLVQLGSLLCCAAALAVPYLWLAAGAVFLALMGFTAVKTRHVAGLLFPLLTFVLGLAFVGGLSAGLFRAAVPARRAGRPHIADIDLEQRRYQQHELA
jgi:GT2 family glycosyltransferase